MHGGIDSLLCVQPSVPLELIQMGQSCNLKSEHVVDELIVVCTESNSTHATRGATRAGSPDVNADTGTIQPNINTSRFFHNELNPRESQKKMHLQSSNSSNPLSASRSTRVSQMVVAPTLLMCSSRSIRAIMFWDFPTSKAS